MSAGYSVVRNCLCVGWRRNRARIRRCRKQYLQDLSGSLVTFIRIPHKEERGLLGP